MKSTKTMNILLFTITTDEKKLVNITLSTTEISKNVLKIEETQVDLQIKKIFSITCVNNTSFLIKRYEREGWKMKEENIEYIKHYRYMNSRRKSLFNVFKR